MKLCLGVSRRYIIDCNQPRAAEDNEETRTYIIVGNGGFLRNWNQ